ncbi:MAG: hypothetical protein J6Z01_00635 [Bacteroidales bacterium]|nr:hypothetical protein [Bacteroidales bacterium]
MKYISFLYIVVIFALIGCRNENEYFEDQEPIREISFFNRLEHDREVYYFGEYIMLDYDFFIGIETPIENRFAMVFAKDNDKCNSFEYDAIVMYLPNSQDSISYYYKNNLIKIQSYIEQSSYFNQNCKFKNKVNVLKYVVQQLICFLEIPKNCTGTYADTKRKRCIQLIDEDIKDDTICWTFGSTIKNNTYSLSLLKTNESVNLLLQ